MNGEGRRAEPRQNRTPDGQRRVFGAANIARVCVQNMKGVDHRAAGAKSLADKPHASRREIERAQRRAKQKEARLG